MPSHTVSVAGTNFRDKHTHYEIPTFVGPYNATIIISGFIEQAFHARYNVAITACQKLTITTEFIRNDQKIKECRDPYKSAVHLLGTVFSLDDIVLEK